MRPALRVATVTVALSFTVASLAAAAMFHVHLEKTEPADKAEVAAPAELKLWFAEPPDLPVTKLVLHAGKDTVKLAPLTRAKDAKAPVIAKIAGVLKAGAYSVDWKTMGDDGHPANGTFTFSVRK